ncbi:MAG: transglycosylase domain-containing protein [Rhizobacter sp.]|nr:transglycosylase domain-containing protein [Ferruginibacter sp.]
MKRSVKILWRLFLGGFILVILLFVCANFGVFGKMPSVSELENPEADLASEIISADGKLMGKYYTENRSEVKYQEISKNVINALIATEDERFEEHSGIDAQAVARAVATVGSQGGGSTITQQVAKMMLNQGKGNILMRSIDKMKEWIVAVKLERNFTKEEIITLYLNRAPWGNIYGIRNASLTYFQKEPIDLKIEEAAVLVGMLKGPSLYEPIRHPKNSIDRRNTVINQMVVAKQGFLSAADGEKLKAKPLVTNYKPIDEVVGIAPYYRRALLNVLKEWCNKNTNPRTNEPYNLNKDGLKIYTTIDSRMQKYAEEAVEQHMPELQRKADAYFKIRKDLWKGKDNIVEAAMKHSDRWKSLKEDEMPEDDIKKTFLVPTRMKIFSWKGNEKHEKDTTMTPYDSIKYHKQLLQTSFVAMDPKTGEVKAWVGGINYKWFKYDHVSASRQVGSTFKPLLYTLAVTDAGYTPETPISGAPLTLGGKTISSGGGGTMANCLAFSRNAAAWHLMALVGVSRTIEFSKQCGIKAKLPPYPSIALGSADIPMMEMLQAYTMFPNKGYNTEPVYVTRIEDKNGNLLHEFPVAQSKQVIGETDAYTMVKIMQGVIKIGTARRVNSYNIPVEKAGKTGTTNGNTDGWFIGYTPDLLAGTWVGCGDPFIPVYSSSAGGSEMGAPKWGIFMSKVYADNKIMFNRQKEFDAPVELKNDLIYADANMEAAYNQGDSLNGDSGNEDGNDYFPDAPEEDIAPVIMDTPKNKKPDDKKDIPKVQMKAVDDKKNQPKPKPRADNDY